MEIDFFFFFFFLNRFYFTLIIQTFTVSINPEILLTKLTFRNISIKLSLQTIGYNMNILRPTACIHNVVINPIKVDNFTSVLNCTTVGQSLD